MITKESLQAQLDSSERELEAAKATVYRLDGIIQLLKHQVAEFDKPEEKEAPKTSKLKGVPKEG